MTGLGAPVLVTERSAAVGAPTWASVSVAELLPGVGSVTPAGAVTVAVLTRLPVAPALMVSVTVKVTEPPTGRLTVSLMAPVPDAAPQVPPLVPAHVQLRAVTPVGSGSATVAPVTALGPVALLTTTVYVV